MEKEKELNVQPVEERQKVAVKEISEKISKLVPPMDATYQENTIHPKLK